MSKFILLHSVDEREGVEIVQPFVFNVDQIVLIETDWVDGDLVESERVNGHSRTKVYVSQSGYRWVSVRESVSEVLALMGHSGKASEQSLKQFVTSNEIAEDKWWDREWRDSYGDGRGGEI
jgi:hypothetical protein